MAVTTKASAPPPPPAPEPEPYVFVRWYPSGQDADRVRRRLVAASRLQPPYRSPRPADGPLASLFVVHFGRAGHLFVAPVAQGDDFATRALREAWDGLSLVALYHPDASLLHPGDLRTLEATMDAEPGAETVTPTPRLADSLRRRMLDPRSWGKYYVAVRCAAAPPAPPPSAARGVLTSGPWRTPPNPDEADDVEDMDETDVVGTL
jgi:hypothetical protein